jgi:hypothetical protein
LLETEKKKITGTLESLITKNEKQRKGVEDKAMKRRSTYEGWDEKFRKLEEEEI